MSVHAIPAPLPQVVPSSLSRPLSPFLCLQACWEDRLSIGHRLPMADSIILAAEHIYGATVRNYVIRGCFVDGAEGEIGLERDLEGEVIEPLKKISFFRRSISTPSFARSLCRTEPVSLPNIYGKERNKRHNRPSSLMGRVESAFPIFSPEYGKGLSPAPKASSARSPPKSSSLHGRISSPLPWCQHLPCEPHGSGESIADLDGWIEGPC